MKHLKLLLLFSIFFGSIHAQVKKPVVNLYSYKGQVIEITDGDTFHCMTSLGFDVYKDLTIRLAEINAPEMKGPDSIQARKSKQYLSSLILGKTVYFNSKQYDKYKRSIADVYLLPTDSVSVNTTLVRKGYAKFQKY